MILRELLRVEHIVPGLDGTDLEMVLGELLAGMVGDEPDGARGERLARDLAFGVSGDVVRASDEAIVVVAQLEAVEQLTIGIATSSTSFAVTGEGADPPGQAQVVVAVLTPRRVSTVREQIVPAFIRFLKDPHRVLRLLQMGTPEEIAVFDELTNLELHEQLLVEDALTPLKYRVYPDSPIDEVTDLMLRRGLHSVPVVGERLEFVGLITTGDVLASILPGRRAVESERDPGRRGPGGTAGELMTRSVLCVSEDQSLIDAAGIMVNRDVEQLPVVRDGELIGLLTRGTVLQYVFAGGPVSEGD